MISLIANEHGVHNMSNEMSPILISAWVDFRACMVML